MSRKGRMPVAVPVGVTVAIADESITVNGPKGTLLQKLIPSIAVKMVDRNVVVESVGVEGRRTNFLGLYRSLMHNMVHGVAHGFEKKLEMVGVGYRAAVQAADLVIQIGFSHPVHLTIPSDLKVVVEKNTLITISGVDKQRVGWFAATIRDVRPPEPYQGKGIRYAGEFVRKKAGKTGKTGKK